MEDYEHIRKLIALKRYETPGDAYFEKFLEDFHERQRTELLHTPTRQLLLDRLEAWFTGNRSTVWMGVSGVAAAGCAALVIALSVAFTQPTGEPVLLGAQLEPEESVEVDTATVSLLREF